MNYEQFSEVCEEYEQEIKALQAAGDGLAEAVDEEIHDLRVTMRDCSDPTYRWAKEKLERLKAKLTAWNQAKVMP